MKRFYDYVCENGHKTEKFVVYEATNLKCECGALATRSLAETQLISNYAELNLLEPIAAGKGNKYVD